MILSIYLPNEIAHQISLLAQKNHISKNLIVREALQEWLARHAKEQWSQTFFDFAPLEEPFSSRSLREDLTSPQDIIF